MFGMIATKRLDANEKIGSYSDFLFVSKNTLLDTFNKLSACESCDLPQHLVLPCCVPLHSFYTLTPSHGLAVDGTYNHWRHSPYIFLAVDFPWPFKLHTRSDDDDDLMSTAILARV